MKEFLSRGKDSIDLYSKLVAWKNVSRRDTCAEYSLSREQDSTYLYIKPLLWKNVSEDEKEACMKLSGKGVLVKVVHARIHMKNSGRDFK